MSVEVELVDSHCHLMLEQFNGDLPQVLERARRAGVQRAVVPGIDLGTSRRAVALAEATPGLFAAVGLHPHNASDWQPSTADELRELAASPKVVAIGEIGLDFHHDYSPREAQRRAFEAQLDLAQALELPVIVHLRDSADEVLAAVTSWSADLGPPLAGRAGVLHAFSGDDLQGQRAAESGFFLGVGGPVTYRNAERRRRITQRLPIERLLVETDSPYLTPDPHRGQRNEPAHVRLVAERLASLLDTTLAAVAARTTANATTLFEWNHGTSNRDLL